MDSDSLKNTVQDKITFSFGKNWQRFLRDFDETRLDQAKASLLEFLGEADLAGKTFLDIGCGSGLFSLAALQLGAKKVVSFDYDPFSAQCARDLHEKIGHPSHWEIHRGSVLDEHFLSGLGTFDIVYSWGVLHHTGKMWEAIEKSAGCVRPGGKYYISIYNKVDGIFGSDHWLRIKKLYNSHPWIGKYIIEPIYVCGKFIAKPLKLQNPLSVIRNYKIRQRGMSWRRDITDWIGGYPYEFASVEEIFHFIHKKMPDFRLINIKNSNHLRPNWFLFRKDPAPLNIV